MLEVNKSFVCSRCGDDKAATYYEYKGKTYCRYCLKAKLGIEEEVAVQCHYPDGEELVDDNLDEIFMQLGAVKCFN